MSFGWAGSDVFLLVRLAWNTVQKSRKACGEYDDLTRETSRLHAVLQRLAQEVAKQESPINRPGETSKEQLERIVIDCEVVLEKLNKIVTKYASLCEENPSAHKILQKVRSGNVQLPDLREIRSKLMSYTSEMLLYLNLVSIGTVGRIEQRMSRDGGVLRDIKIAVEKKTAHTTLGGNPEGSVWTSYTGDDTGFWRGLRRDLIKDGLPSAAIHKHRHLIKNYIKELGARGVLDVSPSIESDQPPQAVYSESGIVKGFEQLLGNCNVNLNSPRNHDRNVGIQPLENFNEQYYGDLTNPNLAEDKNANFSVVPYPGNDHGPSSQFRPSGLDISRNRNLNASFHSRREVHRSATSQLRFAAKNTSNSRPETMPVDRMRPGNLVSLKSSDRNYPKAPSDTSDSSDTGDLSDTSDSSHTSDLSDTSDSSHTSDISSESDSETFKDNHLLPVSKLLARLIFGTAKEGGRKRPGLRVPFLKSSNRKYPETSSDTSDSSSESGSEIFEKNHLPPRPNSLARQTRSRISGERPYIKEPRPFQSFPNEKPRPFQSYPNESRRISERPSVGSRGGSILSPPVAQYMNRR